MNENAATHHYHLITGEVFFHMKEKEQEVSAVRLNGIVFDEGKKLPVRLISRSHQILQLNFKRSYPDENIVIDDVVLFGFSYLGEFTAEEFHKEPEGMKTTPVMPPQTQTTSDTPNNSEAKLKVVPKLILEEAVAKAGGN